MTSTRFSVGWSSESGTETVRMPLSYVALMSSSSAPAGSGTVRTKEPYENSECPLDSLV